MKSRFGFAVGPSEWHIYLDPFSPLSFEYHHIALPTWWTVSMPININKCLVSSSWHRFLSGDMSKLTSTSVTHGHTIYNTIYKHKTKNITLFRENSFLQLLLFLQKEELNGHLLIKAQRKCQNLIWQCHGSWCQAVKLLSCQAVVLTFSLNNFH